MTNTAPEQTTVPWECYAWLDEIPVTERPWWIIAPDGLSYTEASNWADAAGYVPRELIYLSDGRTLLRIQGPRREPCSQ